MRNIDLFATKQNRSIFFMAMLTMATPIHFSLPLMGVDYSLLGNTKILQILILLRKEDLPMEKYMSINHGIRLSSNNYH